MARSTLPLAERRVAPAFLLVSLSVSVAACSLPVEETAQSTGALTSCPVVLACDAAPPVATRGSFRNFGAWVLSTTSSKNHRGHDAFLRPGEDQWIVGKIAYGVQDSPLTGEDVDVYLLRGCGARWEKLGSARTTTSGEHAAVDGVSDDGGRVYFKVPVDKTLGVGRHRVRLVVRGDASATELFLEVLPVSTPIFVSDVDGTLTTSELAEVGGVLTGTLPEANANAAEALHALVKKGYRPLYLTARAERGTERTRQFLAARGFPPGVVQTSFSWLGLTGAPAAAFKGEVLARVETRGFGVEIGFGNTATDSEAYASARIPTARAYFFKFDPAYGTRIETYGALDQFRTLPATCQ